MSLFAATSTDADVLHVASALGFLGFFCLAAAVVWGMALAVGPWAGRVSREGLELGHLAWSVAGLAFVAGHVIAHTLRPAGAFTWVEALVPFARGGPVVAAGVAGWIVLATAAVSFTVRARVGMGRWTAVHRAAYGGFALMTGHVVLAAEEFERATWLGIAAAATIVVVATLSVLRWRRAAPDDERTPTPSAAWGLDP